MADATLTPTVFAGEGVLPVPRTTGPPAASQPVVAWNQDSKGQGAPSDESCDIQGTRGRSVGLCAVLASKRLGADRIIALSRRPARQDVAREFGATDIIEARGEEATQAVLDLTAGIGVDAALECVGTAQSITTAFAVARPGSAVGIVGVPHGQVPFAETFFRNTGWQGGPAPARIYIPELLGDVLDGAINPGRVFDYETDLDHIADAYRAMDERRAIKSLVRVGAV